MMKKRTATNERIEGGATGGRPAQAAAPAEREPMASLQAAAGNHAASRAAVPTGPPEVQALAPAERAYFEGRLGADLGRVRLHGGRRGERVAGQQNAYAATQGEDVYLAREVSGGSLATQRAVVAHELAHVLQQRGSGPAAAPALLEAEATLAGAQVAAGRAVTPALAAPRSAAQRLSRGGRTALFAGLGALGGALLGAGLLGILALSGVALGGAAIAGALAGGAALGGIAGGIIGATTGREKEAEEATPAKPGLTAEQAAAMSEATDWETLARAAHEFYKRQEHSVATRLYQLAILKAFRNVTLPKDVPALNPALEDIQVDFSLERSRMATEESQAETRVGAVADHPDNYWRWLYFGPQSVRTSQAHTEATIYHELIHVRQLRKLWQQYQQAPGGKSWEEFLTPQGEAAQQHERERVLGPEELEAHATILNYLQRLSPSEAETGLEGLFVAYVRTENFTPQPGDTIAMTPEQARPAILSAFRAVDDDMKGRMGYNLWRSLIRVDPPAAVWKRILQELKPVADRGYQDETFKEHYDTFLGNKGLEYKKIGGGTP